MALPAGVVTFVFTDIEGSTALFHALGDDYLPVLDDHNRLMREAIADHHGVEVKTEGDAFFVAFADAGDALRACAAAQLALLAHEWPHGGPLKVRMGVHAGPVEVVDDDYVGLSVAEAARIASAAHGGQVMVSQAAVRAADPAALEPIGFHDLGVHALKDFPEPRNLFQLTHPELPAAFPAPRTLTARSHNLPASPTPLVGRRDELAGVQDTLLHRARLVTVTGSGGMGKSRLTIEAAWSLLSWFREGVWFIGLAPVLAPEGIEGAIAAALGVTDAPGLGVSAALRQRLAAGPTLLVLDNFEHLLDGATVVSDLLASCPQLKVLASSRERLRLRGEHRIDLDTLPAGDAVELFGQRARAVDARFALDDVTRATVERICAQVDRIPLALELAAARVGDLSLDDLAGQLDRALDVLVEGERDLPARQQTLRAAIDWSYRLLPAARQAVLRSAGAFAGHGSAGALAEVHATDGCAEAVADLVEKSLLRWSNADGNDDQRWWMLETIREFAAEQLAEHPDEQASRLARHVELFLALAGSAAERITGPSQAQEMARLAADLDNVRLALSRLDGDRLVSAAAALARFWFRSGLWSEGLSWLVQAHDAATDASAASDRAMVAMAAGLLTQRLTQRLGDAASASAYLNAAVAAGREADDGALLAETLVQLAELRRATGDLAGSEEAAREAEAEARAAGSERVQGSALSTLGGIAYANGDLPRAEQFWTDALDALRRSGDEGLAVGVLNNLALVARENGDLDAAEDRYRSLLDVAKRLRDPHGAALATYNLGGVILERRERFDESRQLLADAMEMFDQIGDQVMSAYALMALGLATNPTDTAAAEAMVEQARQAFVDLGHDPGAAEAAALLAGTND